MHARVPAPRLDYPFLDSLSIDCLIVPIRRRTKVPLVHKRVEESPFCPFVALKCLIQKPSSYLSDSFSRKLAEQTCCPTIRPGTVQVCGCMQARFRELSVSETRRIEATSPLP